MQWVSNLSLWKIAAAMCQCFLPLIVILTQGCQGCTQIRSDYTQMGQIWDLFVANPDISVVTKLKVQSKQQLTSAFLSLTFSRYAFNLLQPKGGN